VNENNRIDRSSSKDYGNCYFCGTKLDVKKTGVNNPDPLAIPNEKGEVSGCCYECDTKYVGTLRRVLWRKTPKEEYEKLLPYIKIIPIKELEEIITLYPEEELLDHFRSLKIDFEKRGFKLKPEPKTKEELLECAKEQREARAILEKGFNAFSPHAKLTVKAKFFIKKFFNH
jgi:hypothetical protein